VFKIVLVQADISEDDIVKLDIIKAKKRFKNRDDTVNYILKNFPEQQFELRDISSENMDSIVRVSCGITKKAHDVLKYIKEKNNIDTLDNALNQILLSINSEFIIKGDAK
jgi:hypothetical protein